MNLEELCAQLKQKRQERGLTIEQVVEKTKLYPSAIRDIEDANTGAINPTYLKGFLKIYASFLGVPTENALDGILTTPATRAKKEKKEKKTIADIKPIVIPARIRRYILPGVAALLVLWLLISAVRLIASHIPRRAKRAAEVSSESAAVASVPKVPVKPLTREVTAAVTAKRTCFIRVKVDGKTFFVGTLSRGRVETYKASKELEFRINDGSAVYLEVNGKPLPPLTSMRKAIKSLKITASGISISK